MIRILIVSAFIIASFAYADDTAAPPASIPPKWSGQIAGHYVESGGNTNSQTVGVSGVLAFQKRSYKTTLQGDFLRTMASDISSVQRSGVSVRIQRELERRFSGYMQESYYRDLFADTKGLEISELGGLYALINNKRHMLTDGLSLAYTREQHSDRTLNRIFWGSRAGISYQLKLGSAAEFNQDFDYLYDFSRSRNWRGHSNTSLTVSVSRLLGFEISNKYWWVNIPSAGKKSGDRWFSVALIAKWPASKP